MNNKILLIIPTLNEFGNIQKIYKNVKKIFKKIDIIFIDDNSTDGSKDAIINLSRKDKKVNYIFRKKKLGIGSAHKVGIKLAKKKKYRYVCTMDADGAHNPKYIKKMFKFIIENNIVITNRFLLKDSLKNWEMKRVLITKLRFHFIKFLLGSKLDGSGGFRLYDLKKININDIFMSKSNNYNFLWESIFLLEKRYKIYEIPIILPHRSIGNSKMKFKDLIIGFFSLLNFFVKYRLKI